MSPGAACPMLANSKRSACWEDRLRGCGWHHRYCALDRCLEYSALALDGYLEQICASTKNKDPRSARSPAIFELQDPRSPGSHAKSKLLDPRSQGSHRKSNLQGPRSNLQDPSTKINSHRKSNLQGPRIKSPGSLNKNQ